MTNEERSGLLSKLIGDKRPWRAYKARVRALPENYRIAVEGIERYLMYFGAVTGENAMSIFDDVVELFEQAAADGTPIRNIVGSDPVEFVDALVRNYAKGGYVQREQDRLVAAIAAAAGE